MEKHRKNKKKGCDKREICTQEGWSCRWTTPRSKQTFLRSIIPGPFVRPKLVYALPYVVTSNCKACIRKNAGDRKLRSGIPDPWLEYLVWKENSSPKDVRSSWDYMWLTDFLWNNRRLAMVQGIPDPWRNDFDCSCYDDDRDVEPRKKPRRISGEEKVSRPLAQRHSKSTSDEKEIAPEREEKIESNVYETVKDNMAKLEGELKFREAEKRRVSRRSAVVVADIITKNQIAASGKESNGGKEVKKVAANPLNDTRRRANKSLEDYRGEIKKYKDDVSSIKRDAESAQRKIQKLKEAQEKRHLRINKKVDEYFRSTGKKEHVSWDDKPRKSIKFNDDEGDINASASITAIVKSPNEFLKKIGDRMETTKSTLNSLDTNKKHKSSSQKSKKGAGEDYNHDDEVIDLQPNLFSPSAIPINWCIPVISDDVDVESTYLKQQQQQRYWETLRKKRNRTAKGNEVLILEPLSDQD